MSKPEHAQVTLLTMPHHQQHWHEMEPGHLLRHSPAHKAGDPPGQPQPGAAHLDLLLLPLLLSSLLQEHGLHQERVVARPLLLVLLLLQKQGRLRVALLLPKQELVAHPLLRVLHSHAAIKRQHALGCYPCWGVGSRWQGRQQPAAAADMRLWCATYDTHGGLRGEQEVIIDRS